MSLFAREFFHDDAAALMHLEAVLWPHGPVCPHCGSVERIYEIKGKRTRLGLRKCGACRKQFTVTVGTVFESSHVPLHKWMQAVFLLCSSKKGISSHQLHRILDVTYKTAWFMSHRYVRPSETGWCCSSGTTGAFGRRSHTFSGRSGMAISA